MLTAPKSQFPLETSNRFVRTLSKRLPAHKPAKHVINNPHLANADLYLRFAAHTPDGLILLPTPTDKDADNIPAEVSAAWHTLSGPIWESLYSRFESERYADNPISLMARTVSDFYQPDFLELQPIYKKHSPRQHAIVGEFVFDLMLSVASQYGTLPPQTTSKSSTPLGIRQEGPEYGLHELVQALQQELEAESAKNPNIFFKLYSVQIAQTFTQQYLTEFVLQPA